MKQYHNINTNAGYSKNFIHYNNSILFDRIKIIAYMLIITYPCFLIVDLFLVKGISNNTYKLMMAVIHLACLITSLLFILIYKHAKKLNKHHILTIYIFFYLLVGAVSSLNSQLFTGNIVAYLVIAFGAAVIFPVRPRSLCYMMLPVHLFFLIGLSFLDKNHYDLLIKQINATGTVVIAFTIAFTIYSYRRQDYFNQIKLKQKEESFRRLFHMNPSPLILMNIFGNKIILMNKQAIEYYQLGDRNRNGADGSFLFKDPSEKAAIVKRLYEKQNIDNYISEQKITTGLTRWAMLHFELIDYLDEQCLLIGLTDITTLKKAEQELLKHASIDILTGVMNRRSGIEFLESHLSLSPMEEFILCFIDINNLKSVNDHYGHAAGDELIKTVCDVIQGIIVSSDVLFRLGGDEFVIVFPQKQRDEVENIWNNIKLIFRNLNASCHYPYSISASHGLYQYIPGTIDTIEEMLENADKEMYKEKLQSKKQR